MKEILQKIYARYKVARFSSKQKFKEALTILHYVKETGMWPEGDAEYAEILASAGLLSQGDELCKFESKVSKNEKIVIPRSLEKKGFNQ